jgi:hypothetical protein
LIDAMGKRVDAALRVAFAKVKEGRWEWFVALGLQWHGTEDLAVNVNRFRIGRVERARMGRLDRWIKVGDRIAGSLFRISRQIRVHGREQHRVHERDLVHGGKSFRYDLLFQFLNLLS